MSTRSIPLPPQIYLKQRFDYDPLGWLIWRYVDNPTHHGATWNTRFAGKRAGRIMDNGYVLVGLDGKQYLAERLIWVWHHGEDPGILVVDHRSRIRYQNWIDNLRLATSSQNGRNKDGQSKLGLPKGVKFQQGRYRPLLQVGQFVTPEEAGQAVELAADKMRFASDRLRDLMDWRDDQRKGLFSRNGYPRGVEHLKQRNVYRGYLSLGAFEEPEEAGAVYQEAARVLFGEFAR